MDSSGVDTEPARPLRILELYSGIGGCSAALSPRAEVVAAMDINETALEIYRRNYPHPTLPVNLEFTDEHVLVPDPELKLWRFGPEFLKGSLYNYCPDDQAWFPVVELRKD